MKKFLAAVFALTLTLSLAACGDKDSSSEKTSDNSSSSVQPTEEEVNSDISPLSEKDQKKAFELIAGSKFETNGLSRMGDKLPAEYDGVSLDELKERYEKEPVTISSDGVLHLDGKDYQLIPQELNEEDEKAIFSVEGSGFSLKKFKKSYKVSSKEYSGVAAAEYTVSHGTFNGEDWPIVYINVYITSEGSESYCVGLTFSPESD